jgi:hypothetical protein
MCVFLEFPKYRIKLVLGNVNVEDRRCFQTNNFFIINFRDVIIENLL